MSKPKQNSINLIHVINKLEEFWSKLDLIKILPHDQYVGAATFHPYCFFSILRNKKDNGFYFTQPS